MNEITKKFKSAFEDACLPVKYYESSLEDFGSVGADLKSWLIKQVKTPYPKRSFTRGKGFNFYGSTPSMDLLSTFARACIVSGVFGERKIRLTDIYELNELISGRVLEGDAYDLHNNILFIGSMYHRTRGGGNPYPKNANDIELFLIRKFQNGIPVILQSFESMHDEEQDWWYADLMKLVAQNNREIKA